MAPTTSRPDDARPVASVVVPCHDNLPYTALCLRSIALHTPEPHEVVVVDNGCRDGTAEWCAAHGARVVSSPENLGFAGGANLGLAAARGDALVVLNNDALATPGWLSGLLGALERQPGVGVAGPRSNLVAGPQMLDAVPYRTAPSPELDRFAAERHGRRSGAGWEVPFVSGLCMAIARDVVDRVGGFDPRFEIGNWEDDDLSTRVRLAGARLWVADDSYVHHFGHRTFAALPESMEELMLLNRARYAAKWDLPLDADPKGHLPARPFDPGRDRVPLP